MRSLEKGRTNKGKREGRKEGRKEGRNGWNEKENLNESSIFHVLMLIMNVIDFFSKTKFN